MKGRDPAGKACVRCGKGVSRDEAALTRKLINRGMDAAWCLSCLGEHFRVDRRTLENKIDQFREQGCTLFDAER